MLKELEDANWREAFGYAGCEPGTSNQAMPALAVPPTDPRAAVQPPGFCREDVAVVIWSRVGVYDGSDWLMLGQLRDGRFFFLAAGCDYTGWDCQSGGHSAVAHTFENIWRWGVTERARKEIDLPKLEMVACLAHHGVREVLSEMEEERRS